MPPNRYRLYIDESGTAGTDLLNKLHERYLGLTAIAVEWNHLRDFIIPTVQDIKWRYFEEAAFNDDPDHRVILHRTDIRSKKNIFLCLKDETIRNRYNADLLQFLADAEFIIISVVIDKASHLKNYGKTFAQNPYHYCLYTIIENYCELLLEKNARGDIIAEARGRKEDKALQAAYDEIFTKGHDAKSASYFQGVLSSGKIRIRYKGENLYGLQLADLLAQPLRQSILEEKEGIVSIPPECFSTSLLACSTDKYYRDLATNQVDGMGRIYIK